MSTASGVLLLVGSAAEFVGILLIAWPDFVPFADRVASWFRAALQRGRRWARRRIGRPTAQRGEVGTAPEQDFAGRISPIKTAPTEWTLEEQVAWLLRRDQEAQRDANELRARIADAEQASARQVEDTRAELTDQFSTELASALAKDRPVRILGTVLLAVGLTFTVIANFV